MTPARIEVPESLRFYFGDKANRAAVEQVLEGPTFDFDWKDLGEFYDAWLSAQKVQIDYWRFILGVWEKVWGEALEQYFPSRDRGREYEREPSWYYGSNFHEPVWDAGWLNKGFSWTETEQEKTEGELEKWGVFGVWDEYGSLGLHFWLWDGSQYVKELDLGSDWILNTVPDEGEEDGGEYDSAQPATLSLIPLQAESLDISPLKEKADEAVKRMANYLPG